MTIPDDDSYLDDATPPPNPASDKPEEQYPKLARFRRYFGKPVSLQLRTPMLQLDYSGHDMAIGEGRFGLLAPAIMQGEDGKPEAVGMASFLPRVVIQPSADGEHILAWMQSPATDAVIEMNIEPDQVCYVCFVVRLPSPIVRPSQN